MLQFLWIRRRLTTCRPEVNREQRRRAVQQLVPTLIDLGREVMPFRIVFVGPEFSMMVEVPSGELAGGNSARNRIEQRQNPFHDRAAPLENRVVNDLVQQDGEVENRESLHQRQRHPDEWVVETDEAPRSEREDCKLSRCHRGVPPGIFLVQLAHLFARKRPPKLSSERNRVLRVVMRFHGNKQLYPGSGMRDPGSVVRDPGADPNSTADRIRRPGWGMRRPSSRFGSDPGARIPDPGSQTTDRGSIPGSD